MPSKKNPDQPDRIDPADAEAPTQQVSVDPAAPDAPAAPAAAHPAPAAPAAPAATAAPAAPAAPEPASPELRRNRFAWVSSPKVAAATVITVLALGGLGGAFALGRATAGHDDHGPRGVLVQMGVPGGQGFDGRGFGHRFGSEVPPGLRGELVPAPQDDQEDQTTPTPAPSDSTDG